MMKVVLEERKNKHIEDDAGIQKCWDKMVDICSENENETIIYLLQCSKEELDNISEIFEDISVKLQSKAYIKCLRKLDKKFPELEMKKDIDIAEEYL